MEGNRRKTLNLEEVIAKYLPEGTLLAIKRLQVTEEGQPSRGFTFSVRDGSLRLAFCVDVPIRRLAIAAGAAVGGIWTLIEIAEWASHKLRGPGP